MILNSKKYKKIVIKAYKNMIIRFYCYMRFIIINMRILEEIEQYIPQKGITLDVGCGFGLFSLFFSLCGKERQFISFDLNARRIDIAQEAAKALGLQDRVEFIPCNVLEYKFNRPVEAMFVLDLLHHIPREAVPEIIASAWRILPPGGIFLIKDIDAQHHLKTAFTWILDKIMDYRTPVAYWRQEDLLQLLIETGFDVKVHNMLDILPYPHILYICNKISTEEQNR
jgi:2-polyprenyl-3-methyl-5-hydroxy-6-metoxy-1,4-benzoquinol methylase